MKSNLKTVKLKIMNEKPNYDAFLFISSLILVYTLGISAAKLLDWQWYWGLIIIPLISSYFIVKILNKRRKELMNESKKPNEIYYEKDLG